MLSNIKFPTYQNRKAYLTSSAEYSGYVVYGTSKMMGRNFFMDGFDRTDYKTIFVEGGDLNKQFDAYSKELFSEIKESVTDSRWRWSGRTRRRNGTLVGSPRNIVDTGELLRGLELRMD